MFTLIIKVRQTSPYRLRFSAKKKDYRRVRAMLHPSTFKRGKNESYEYVFPRFIYPVVPVFCEYWNYVVTIDTTMEAKIGLQLHPPYGFWEGDYCCCCFSFCCCCFFVFFVVVVFCCCFFVFLFFCFFFVFVFLFFCFCFFENLIFQLPWQPIKINELDKIHTVCRGLLQEHFCKMFVKISATR